MTHVRTSPFYPQSNGKIERWHQSLKGECIRPGTPLSPNNRQVVPYLMVRDGRAALEFYQKAFGAQVLYQAPMPGIFAQFKAGEPETIVAKISQETLAELVGTTRSRVNFFMNKFRKLGFIHYNGGGMQIHSSLLNVVLHD
jgi:CRP/FNR family cyclic AMP-dependent transcriptional regulator